MSIFTNEALLNAITPLGGLEFTRNDLIIGENYCKIYAIIHYPSTLDHGWAARFSTIPNIILNQTFLPCNASELIDVLSKSINQNRLIAESTKDTIQKQRAIIAAEDAEKLIMRIDRENETVGNMINLIMPVARDTERLERLCRIVESTAAAMKLKVRVLPNLQKESLMAISPYHPMITEINNMTSRMVPFSTFMGGFPFSSSGYSDRKGIYFAQDVQGGLVVLDTWRRDADRTNSNWVITGVPGTGKSATSKHIIMNEFMLGTKVIIIDVEREYMDLCKSLNGDWIDTAGGSGGMINPLQVLPSQILNDEEDIGDSKMSDLALHLMNLEIFFELYIPDMSEIQKSKLNKLLVELYSQFGIDWNTNVSHLKPDNFPIMSDFYSLIKSCEEMLGDQDSDISFISSVIYELAEGAHRYLFNGHTSLNTNTRLICLDTNAIHGAADKLKRTQYFNILRWSWEQMAKNRSEKVLLVCDEAYTLIDPAVPQSLVFLRTISKRARKYESGLMIISQSITDFLSPEVKMYGQALLDNPTYKVLFGTDGKNLEETKELYNLTEAEQDYLVRKERSTAIFMIGSKRIAVRFVLPQYKLDLMGKAGGR